MNLDEYKLDFVIPKGACGLESILFANYQENQKGMLPITNYNTLPNPTTNFTVANNEIALNEPGFYEITLSGKLSKNAQSATLYLEMIDYGTSVMENIITVELTTNAFQSSTTFFSQTKILQIDAIKSLRVYLSSNDTAFTNQLNITIKKIRI